MKSTFSKTLKTLSGILFARSGTCVSDITPTVFAKLSCNLGNICFSWVTNRSILCSTLWRHVRIRVLTNPSPQTPMDMNESSLTASDHLAAVSRLKLPSEVINNIGTNPRKYESSIQKGEMERSQQQPSEAMAKFAPYYKWFTTGTSHTR